MEVVAKDENGETAEATGTAIAVTAAEATPAEYFTVVQTSGNFGKITAYTGTDTAVVIPSEIGEYTIEAIGASVFKNNTSIISVTMPATLKIIGSYAFQGCTNLKGVSLNNGLESIYRNAFEGCTSLTSIYIPDTVTGIARYAFRNCSNLSEMNYPIGWQYALTHDNIVKDYVTDHGQIFDGTALITLEIPEGITNIPDYAFMGCTNFEYFELPDSVNNIGAYAFRGCTGLSSMVLPDGIEQLYAGTFQFCTGLESVDLPASIEILGSYQFEGCTNLKDIELPDGLQSIYRNAFEACTSLTSLYIPDTVVNIARYAFYNCSNLSEMNYPVGWQYALTHDNIVKDYVTDHGQIFEGTALKTLVIPEGITSIPDYAFMGCTNFAYFELPDSISTVGAYAFRGCTGLTTMELPQDITQLYAGTFQYCTGLVSVTLPNSLEILGSYQFAGCTHLASIELPEGLNTIYRNAFEGCTSLTSLYIPDTVTSIARYAFYNCSKLSEMNYPVGWQYALTHDNIVKDYVTDHGQIFEGTALKTLVIPEGVTSIPDYAFMGCTNFAYFDLPESITSVGKYAFRNCTGLTSMELNDDIIQLNPGTFQYCTGLESINLPNNLEILGSSLFEGCTHLVGITLPETVTSIGDYAFKNCADTAFTSIYLPDSVSYIGREAFYGCSNLAEINYPIGWASANQYGKIFVGTKITSMDIPEGVTAIPDYAFRYCTNFTSIILTDSLTDIGSYAFQGCTGLSQMDIPDDVTVLSYCAFEDCTGLTSITLPEGLTTIEDYALKGCTNLTSLYIPDSVTTIYREAFRNCTKLASMNYPMGWTTANSNGNVFTGTALTTLVIPEGVTSIPQYAFRYCTNFTHFELPDSLQSIPAYAFAGCTNLEKIWIPEGIELRYDEDGNQTSFVPIASTAFNDVSTSTMSIHGVSGSYAETFAAEKGYPFVAEAFEYTPATLSGTVTDAAGNPLSGVTVTVYKGPTTNYPFGTTTTDSTGAWSMENVKVGSYYGVGFEMEGYVFNPSLTKFTVDDSAYTVPAAIGTQLGQLPTITGYRINNASSEVVVAVGDTLSFDGVIASGEANIFAVQISVYDASADILGSVGDKYYHTGVIDVAAYDLADVPVMTVGDTFGDKAYSMTAGNSYVVMLYASNANGNGFVDEDPDTEGYQGPSITVHVVDALSSTEWNGHAYQLINNGMTWSEAKECCEAMGGHLATITSEEENAAIATLLNSGSKNSYWLGGHLDNGVWTWVTNEEFAYSNWSSGQPDNYTGTETALMMYRNSNPDTQSNLGEWNDLNRDGTCEDQAFFGTDNFGFVCEFDSGVEPSDAPAVLSAEFAVDTVCLDTATSIMVTTEEEAGVLAMYAENRDWGRCAVWSVASAQTEVVDGVRVWNVQYTFNTTGDRTLSFAASTDGKTEGDEKTASIKVVEAEMDIIVQDFELSRYIAEPEDTISIYGIVSGGDRELQLVTISLCPDGDVSQGVEIWSSNPGTTEFDLSTIPELVVGQTYSGTDYAVAQVYNRAMLLDTASTYEATGDSSVTMEPGCDYEIVVNAALTDGTTIEEEVISRSVIVQETTIYTGEVATQTSEDGKKFIKSWESKKLREYDDGLGNPTIGYGHKILSTDTFEYSIEEVIEDGETKKYRVITDEVAEALFEADVLRKEGTVNAFLELTGAKVNQQQYDALSSFFFNGNADPVKGAFNPQSCMATLFRENANSLDSIPDWRIYNQLANYYNRTATDVDIRKGLHKRRLDEARIFTEGIYERRNWNVEEWVINGEPVSETWKPIELGEIEYAELEAPEFNYYPEQLYQGANVNVSWEPVEGANYYNLWYRLNTWDEAKYAMCGTESWTNAIDFGDATAMWISLYAMIDGSHHGPGTTIEMKISDLGDLSFSGYTLGQTEALDVSSLGTEGFKLDWSCQNAVKYQYKILVLSENPSGNDQESAAENVYTGTVTTEGMTITSDMLKVGKYLKIAVVPVGKNGNLGTWRWIGLKIEDSKPDLTKPIWDSVPESITSGESFTISWEPVDNAVYYNLWYRVDGTDNMLYKRVDAPACSADIMALSQTDAILHVSLYALTAADNYSASAYNGIPLNGVETIPMSSALYKTSGGYVSCGFDGYVTTSGRHEGIDFVLGYGKDVYSLTSGKITYVKQGSEGSGGLSTIAIYNCDFDKTVIYLHSDPVDTLKVGQNISVGQKIATESWRGCSSKSGTHTHVEVRDGERERAAKSVNDPVLDNEDPTSFWNSLGYSLE